MTWLHYLKDCAEINKMLNASIKSLATIHWPLSTIHLATPPGEKCGVVLFSSIGSGDNGRGIDFDQIVGVDQARDLNQGAGRIVVTPKLSSHLVNGLEVFHVHQEDVDAGNILQGAAHGLQGGLDIVEHLAGLQPDVPSAYQMSLDIDGYLAGNEVGGPGPPARRWKRCRRGDRGSGDCKRFCPCLLPPEKMPKGRPG